MLNAARYRAEFAKIGAFGEAHLETAPAPLRSPRLAAK